jgi:hypothetical protein
VLATDGHSSVVTADMLYSHEVSTYSRVRELELGTHTGRAVALNAILPPDQKEIGGCIIQVRAVRAQESGTLNAGLRDTRQRVADEEAR